MFLRIINCLPVSCSVGGPQDYYNEELLYKLFGVNAERLIDHAWGWESCTMADIKAYKPASNSIGSGQVLQCPYTAPKARLVVREMADMLALDLVDRGLVTDQVILDVGYDIDNLAGGAGRNGYHGEIKKDHYGRSVPKPAHGSARLPRRTSSSRQITEAVLSLYDRIVDPTLLVRRLNLTVAHVVDEAAAQEPSFEQLDLFTDLSSLQREREAEKAALARERKMQRTVLDIKKKFGKNAILRGMDLEEGATTAERNQQIGGHQA